jgi:hypothetical protein
MGTVGCGGSGKIKEPLFLFLFIFLFVSLSLALSSLSYYLHHSFTLPLLLFILLSLFLSLSVTFPLEPKRLRENDYPPTHPEKVLGKLPAHPSHPHKSPP